MVKAVDIQATLAELPVPQGRSTETPEEEVSEAFAALAERSPSGKQPTRTTPATAAGSGYPLRSRA